MDLFLAYAYHDEDLASRREDTLAGRGLVIGEPLSLWPGQRLFPQIDLRLHESRRAIVIVSSAFLAFWWHVKLGGRIKTRGVQSMRDDSMTRRWRRCNLIGVSLVIGIVGALGAWLYPSVREARRAARAATTL